MLDFHATVDPNVGRLFYAQPADTNHVLTAIKDVQQFYQDSFANLLWTMGTIVVLMTFIMGVVMPLVLQWSRSRSFNKTEQNLLEKFQNDIEAAKADLKSEIDLVKTELKQKAGKSLTEITAETLMSSAGTLALTSSNTFEITLLSLRGAWRYAKLQDTEKLEIAIGLAIAAGKKINQNLIQYPLKERKECVSLLLEECENTLEELKDKQLDTKYFEQVLAIRDIVNKIKLSP